MVRTEYALVDGIEFKINTDFKVALRCSELIGSDEIDDMERAIAVVTLLFGKECPVTEEALKKAEIYLSNGENASEKTLIDYNQDWSYIYSAFKGQYGIDIDSEEMHYEQFLDMMRGIHKQVLNDIVAIRDIDLSDIKDRKERKRIADLKEKLSIKKNIENPQAGNEFMKTYFEGRG